MEEDDKLLRQVSEMMDVVNLGIEAKEFMSTDLGKYLTTRAQMERQSALESLLKINPTDTDAVRNAQNRAIVANMVIVWLDQAIMDGQNADASLEAFYQTIN